MPTFKFSKLVRDNIVDHQQASGARPRFRTLNDEEHKRALIDKIIEESKEIIAAGEDEIVSEIADVQQAIDDLKNLYGLKDDDVAYAQRVKTEKNGTFKKGIFVEHVEVDESDPWVDYFRRNAERYPEVKQEEIMMEKHVRVGIGVFVFKDGKFLMQKRKGSHGEGSWSVPGGHLEFGESFEGTARREVKEETGLEIQNIRFGAVTNDHFVDEDEHYVTVWMLSDWKSGIEHITESEKCTAQQWCTFDTLPRPLFLSWQQLLPSGFFEKIKVELV